MNSSLSTYLILYTGVLIIAGNGLFAKGIPLDASSITFLRSLVAFIGLVTILVLVVRTKTIISLRTRFGVYGLGILLGLHWVTFFHSMQISTIAIGMVSLFTFPIMTVFMEAAVNKNWPHWIDIISTIAVLIGIIFIIADEPIELSSASLQGTLWGLLSALLFSARNVTQKYYFSSISSETLMLHQMLAIVVALSLFVDYPSIRSMDTNSWIAIATLGLLSTAIAHTLIVISYKRLAAKTVAMISCIQPVAAALLGWIFIDERPTLFITIGGAIILSVAIYESISTNTKS